MPSSSPMKPHTYINYQKAKHISFFAIAIAIAMSIFIYISICYDIFNLSSSTLLSNSNFWFLISNTLILIIAADYGAFSTSKHRKHDLYDEYYYALRCQASRSSAEHHRSIQMEEKTVADEDHHRKKIDKTPEKPEIMHELKHVTFNDDDNNNVDLQRSKTRKHEQSVKLHELPAEANEFSTMSDEELNRRVEEFIEKFNRQIKLQANAC
ncbi:hypothetical protein V6N13_015655 [Hibiscus sabdariffa]|uniref:Uncharacterized protein n=1 Tax=Hibiscus sabdariffa TaxID=183260 RepID=A0ABR2CY30_9ROSI